MSMYPDQDSGVQDLNNNNRLDEWDDILNPTSLKDMQASEKARLVSEHLFGVRVNNTDGPKRSMRAIARRKLGGPACIEETNEIVVDVVPAKQERQANYAQHGWSLDATAVIPPWTHFRMTNCNMNPVERPGEWITKRFILRRLVFDLAEEELEAEPEFEADVRKALAKPSDFEKVHAFYRVLQLWGDVVPLEFDAGISLSITNTDKQCFQFPNARSTSIQELMAMHAVRIVKQSEQVVSLDMHVGNWLAQPAPATQWSQIRVSRVIPTTDLLDSELQERIKVLFTNLISYTPSSMPGIHDSYYSKEDDPMAARAIKSITVSSAYFVNYLLVTYLDGVDSGLHGKEWTQMHKFHLKRGEHITEVVTWSTVSSDTIWLSGIQFVTNRGRVSRHHGEAIGKPTIHRTKNGVLAGLVSMWREHPTWGYQRLNKIQMIWRHDVIGVVPNDEDVFSDYFGGGDGVPFNDREVVGNSPSMRIAKLEVGWKVVIEYIRITYEENGRREVAHHGGGSASNVSQFELEAGENIVTISGKCNDDNIVQLCFVTNRGRASEVFGGTGGRNFSEMAPRGRDNNRMRLQYMLGKSQKTINGVIFAWTPN